VKPLLVVAFAVPIAALAGAAFAGRPPRTDYESHVVSLHITSQAYNQFRPWETKTPETHVAQAVVVDGPLLLATADLVEGVTLILAEKRGGSVHEPARIVHLDADANLVLLTVDAPGFFADLKPVTMAQAIPLEGPVSSVRWQSGQMEVAASRVSGIDVDDSRLGAFRHAFLKLETDISAGGWGEPVFVDGTLLGLTYSQDGQSATVIPADILRSYLEAARAPGSYREFPNLQLSWQVNRDPALTRSLGLEGEPRGVLVTRVPSGSSVCGALLPRDILLEVDGHRIDAEGNYDDPQFGRVEFTQAVADGHHAGEVVPAAVLRGGKEVRVRVKLEPAHGAAALIPVRDGGVAPPYLIAGGFVFRELNADYLRAWGKDWRKKAPTFLLTQYDLFRKAQAPDKRRIVLLAYVLPAAYNLGYGGLEDMPVARINGRPIDSIADVSEALGHPEGEFQRIEFAPNPDRFEAVLDAATLAAATEKVLKDYQVPQAMRLPVTPPPDLGEPCPNQP
jgi:hypothetical protein